MSRRTPSTSSSTIPIHPQPRSDIASSFVASYRSGDSNIDSDGSDDDSSIRTAQTKQSAADPYSPVHSPLGARAPRAPRAPHAPHAPHASRKSGALANATQGASGETGGGTGNRKESHRREANQDGDDDEDEDDEDEENEDGTYVDRTEKEQRSVDDRLRQQSIKLARGLETWKQRVGITSSAGSSTFPNVTASQDPTTPLLVKQNTRYDAIEGGNPASGSTASVVSGAVVGAANGGTSATGISSTTVVGGSGISAGSVAGNAQTAASSSANASAFANTSGVAQQTPATLSVSANATTSAINAAAMRDREYVPPFVPGITTGDAGMHQQGGKAVETQRRPSFDPHDPESQRPRTDVFSDDDVRLVDSDNLVKNGRFIGRRVISQMIWVAITLSQGVLFPFFTMGESSPNGSTNSDWYQNLDRPPYSPPIAGHYVILILVSFTQARAAWMIWRRGGLASQAPALFLFFASFSLYQCWTVIFFCGHSAGGSIPFAFLMVISSSFAVVMFRARLKRAGQLLIPWLIWMIFLTIFTIDITVRN